MGTNPTYSEEYLIKRLSKHCIDEHLSKYTTFKPTWQGYLKRMDNSDEFANKVNDILAEADLWFNKTLVENMVYEKDGKRLDPKLFALATANKKFTLDDRVENSDDDNRPVVNIKLI